MQYKIIAICNGLECERIHCTKYIYAYICNNMYIFHKDRLYFIRIKYETSFRKFKQIVF